METLESSRVCRLCGKQSGISINIFDENENHVRKINAVLPIMVHEMDLLPKHMCHRCSYKLEEFHKFYVDCLKTDTTLKSQLSWMSKECSKEKIGVPMVHIENTRIKTEPLEHSDIYQLEPIVENINYINSMKSMTFPANGIHDGLTYATFSPRCRYCCDNKNQSSRRKTRRPQLCRNYEKKRMSKHDKIAENLRKNTTTTNTIVKDTTTNAIGDIKRNVLTHTLVRNPRNSLLRTVKNTQSTPLTTVETTKDISLTTQNHHPHDRLATIPSSPSSTIVRNLRPRKDLVNYTLAIKPLKRLNIPDTSRKSTVLNTKTTSPSMSSDFNITREIKIEKIDEFEARSLRPRKTTVNYHGPTRQKKVSETHYEQKCSQSDKVKRESINKDALNNVTVSIKRETIKLSDVVKPPAKITILPAIETNDNTRNNNVVNFFKSHQLQSENQLQRKSTLDITRNKLVKSKRLNRFSAANYSPKSLRSQDIHLRNGKRYDYRGWSLKKLQTRRLMDTVKSKVPTMLKLVEGMKHYCESCNINFMNKELFRLHACDFE